MYINVYLSVCMYRNLRCIRCPASSSVCAACNPCDTPHRWGNCSRSRHSRCSRSSHSCPSPDCRRSVAACRGTIRAPLAACRQLWKLSAGGGGGGRENEEPPTTCRTRGLPTYQLLDLLMRLILQTQGDIQCDAHDHQQPQYSPANHDRRKKNICTSSWITFFDN